MGKIKKALATLGLAALVGSGIVYGGRESRGGDYCSQGASEESFTERQKELYQRKLRIGEFIARLFEGGGCDYARAHLFPIIKKDKSGNLILDSEGRCIVENQKLIISCYEKDEERRWPLWRIVLDEVCYASKSDNQITIDTARGDIIKLDGGSAEKAGALTGLFTEYTLANNQEKCADYRKIMIKQFYLD